MPAFSFHRTGETQQGTTLHYITKRRRPMRIRSRVHAVLRAARRDPTQSDNTTPRRKGQITPLTGFVDQVGARAGRIERKTDRACRIVGCLRCAQRRPVLTPANPDSRNCQCGLACRLDAGS